MPIAMTIILGMWQLFVSTDNYLCWCLQSWCRLSVPEPRAFEKMRTPSHYKTFLQTGLLFPAINKILLIHLFINFFHHFCSDSFTSLLYGSIGGTLTIWTMCWVERITATGELTTVFHKSGRLSTSRPLMSLDESLDIFIFGIKNLVNALLILILAWTVGEAFTECGTGVYIASALEDSVDAGAYPALTFVISAILALVTGSSWGTMSIM